MFDNLNDLKAAQANTPPENLVPQQPPRAGVEDIFSPTENAATTDRAVLYDQVHQGAVPADKSAEIREFIETGTAKKSILFKIIFTIFGLVIVAFVAYFIFAIFFFNKVSTVKDTVVDPNVAMQAETAVAVDLEAEAKAKELAAKIDTDQDGLTDLEEEQLGTDRLRSDSDRDGLSDYDEVRVFNTDPMNPDTDGDLEMDGKEVKVGTNPLQADNVPAPAVAVSEPMIPVVSGNTVSSTEASVPVDSDSDGLSDAEEARLGTNPLKADSDMDGLSDYQEYMIYKTDPLNPDSDGDGYLDGAEVSGGYNPNGEGRL